MSRLINCLSHGTQRWRKLYMIFTVTSYERHGIWNHRSLAWLLLRVKTSNVGDRCNIMPKVFLSWLDHDWSKPLGPIFTNFYIQYQTTTDAYRKKYEGARMANKLRHSLVHTILHSPPLRISLPCKHALFWGSTRLRASFSVHNDTFSRICFMRMYL